MEFIYLFHLHKLNLLLTSGRAVTVFGCTPMGQRSRHPATGYPCAGHNSAAPVRFSVALAALSVALTTSFAAFGRTLDRTFVMRYRSTAHMTKKKMPAAQKSLSPSGSSGISGMGPRIRSMMYSFAYWDFSYFSRFSRASSDPGVQISVKKAIGPSFLHAASVFSPCSQATCVASSPCVLWLAAATLSRAFSDISQGWWLR